MNFYECIAKGLDTGLSPETVQSMTLMHFARILFVDLGKRETPAQVYDETTSASLVLREAGMKHAAIRQWIAKVHAAEPHMHKDPRDWYRAYPKLLKGAALRFLYYHRKPHRIMCKLVMAHLLTEIFCCRIGFVVSPEKMDDPEWIYPLDSEDYYIDMDIVSIAIICKEKGHFELQQPEPFLVVAAAAAEEMIPKAAKAAALKAAVAAVVVEPSSFMLRKYSVESLDAASSSKEHINVQVGMFARMTDGVYVINYQPLPKSPMNMHENIYQVYPGDESKTYYTIPPGCSIFVFRLFAKQGTDKRHFAALAQTASHDVYLYFHLPQEDTRGVLVVCAESAEVAEKLILDKTQFVL